MLITINTSAPSPIDWGATGASEIAQNVMTLISTFKYEVAYDRILGLSSDYVDLPLQDAIPLVTAQIYAVVDEREPRATVEEVTYLGTSTDGNLIFQVVIEV